MSTEKLGQFLKEVSNWYWDEFVRAEHDKTYTSNQAVIFALIRACALEKMDAIKMSLNRLDGKLKTPIKIEYPKIFYIFPNAKKVENQKEPLKALDGQGTKTPANKETGTSIILPEPELTAEDLPSLSLRDTLNKMSDYPRELPEGVIELAQNVEKSINQGAPMPDEIPMVKSVVAAHLLVLAQQRNIDALGEVFDQIDGKLAETLQIIGEDIYITSYRKDAPAGAELNEEGIFQIEATKVQDLWAQKLTGGKV